MNRDIMILREVITKLVPLLTGRGLKVTQRGTEAYVLANARTNKPEVVNIPAIPNDASPDFIAAVQGFIDHEVGHVLFTDWSVYGGDGIRVDKFSPEGKALSRSHNIIEDTMIERQQVKAFPGAEFNLDRLHRHFLAKITTPAVAQAKGDEKAEFNYLLVPMMRALSGQAIFQEFMDQNGYWKHPMIENLHMALSDEALELLKKASSTAETFEVAQELHDILFHNKKKDGSPVTPPSPSSQQQSPVDPDDDQDGESSDKPEKKAGAGDGDGERDHDSSDEEGEDEGNGGSAASNDEAKPGDEGDDAEGGNGSADDDDSEDGSESSSGSTGDNDEKPEGDETEDEESGGAESDDNDEKKDDAPGDGVDKEEDADDSDAGDGAEEDGDGETEENGDDQTGADEGDGEEKGESHEGDNGPEESEESEEYEDNAGGDAKDDVSKNGGGVGGAGGKSMFDIDPDDFTPLDISSAMSQEIQQMAQKAVKDADYSVFTKDEDQIKLFEPIDRQMKDEWVPELDDTVMNMVGPMQKTIERLMAAQSLSVRTAGHRSGRLHSPSLYRVLQGDDRVFQRKQEHNSKDTAVMLLIDNSGSMSGGKLVTAMQCAYALGQTLERVNIANEILGFTTGTMSRQAMQQAQDEYSKHGVSFDRVGSTIVMPIFKLFQERMTAAVKKRIAFQLNMQMGLNVNIDGESLEYGAMRLLPRRERRKVMIVLSDGQPIGRNSGSHLKATVQNLTKMGIETVGIGIQSDAVKYFYPNYLTLSNVSQLPEAVMGELKRILTK